MSVPALDGFTILGLGAAVGWLYTQQSKAEQLMAKSVQEYRAAAKPAANRPTPAEIRQSHAACPIDEINLAVNQPGMKKQLRSAEAAHQKNVQGFDNQSGGLNLPPPPVIEGVYLTYGAQA